MSSPAPFGFLPAGAYSGLRRSVIDPETGNPVVTSAPTGEVIQRSAVLPIGRDDGGRLTPAVPGLLTGMVDAAAFPGQVARGEASIRGADGRISDEAVGRGFDLAGTAMTGSLPFGAPKGALRMFGGAAEQHADDPLAALSAALGDLKPNAAGDRPHTFVDPKAKQWDLYHGTNAADDFDRFRVDLPRVERDTKAAPGEAGALFLSPAAAEAEHYAGDIAAATADGYGYRGGAAGPRVIRATVDPGKTDLIDIPHLYETDPSFVERARQAYFAENGGDSPLTRQVFDTHHAQVMDDIRTTRETEAMARAMGFDPMPPKVKYGYGATSAAVDLARERGLDTAVIRGLNESNGGDQVIALTPGRVRSFYAPDQLLYSGGPAGAGLGAAILSSPGDAQASPLPSTGSKGPPMTSGIPFGFGALPIPNADPNDPRRLLQRMPFDPAQAPGVSPATDLTGPKGALVHHPGWSVTGTGAGRTPEVAMDEAEMQRLEAPPGAEPDGAGVQVGQAGRYPGIAELFDRTPMGAPQAFAGTSGTIVPGQGAAPQTSPLPPARPDDEDLVAPRPSSPRVPFGFGGPPQAAAPAASQADLPVPGAVSAIGRASPDLPQTTMQGARVASGNASASPPGTGQEGEMSPFLQKWKALGDSGTGDLLTSIGIGLMSTRGLGPGLAAGLKNYQEVSSKHAATDLAKAEFGLRLQKAAQEATGLKGNQAFIKAAFPNLAPEQVAAGASNGTLVSAAIAKMQNPNAGREMKADSSGVNRWVDTGQPVFKDDEGKSDAQLVDVPIGGGQTQKQWVKKGEPTGTAVGQASPPDKPQGFDIESKLRGEFNKGLGSFQDVHDGYGRVIAATHQRQENPDGKSPAADISLIFGYMKMLDPGSVVREGEYATAGNAGGLDDRLRNTYNKLLNGESLTPAQRQDFIGQANELYGTARKNAEAVAGRYRNLAGQYKVDPDRSVYLPEAPTAPTVGPNKMRPNTAPAGAPSRIDLESEARRRGLLR